MTLSSQWWWRIIAGNAVVVVVTFGILVLYIVTNMVQRDAVVVYLVLAVWATTILSADIIIASGVMDQ